MDNMDFMMDIFVSETGNFLNTLEEILLESEKDPSGIRRATPEIFRIMHTIKSSSAMMGLDNISQLTHKLEDLFYYLRENDSQNIDNKQLIDIVLDGVDFIKRNMSGSAKEDPKDKIIYISEFLDKLKNGSLPASKPTDEPSKIEIPSVTPNKRVLSDENSGGSNTLTLAVKLKQNVQMMGLRAFEIQNKIKSFSNELTTIPENVIEEEEKLKNQPFYILANTSKSLDEILTMIRKSPFVEEAYPAEIENTAAEKTSADKPQPFVERRNDRLQSGSFANVEIKKLDNLVNLVSEILLSQMEIARDIEQRDFERGENAVGNLKKLILKLQEATLSTRMVSVRETFMKMNRIIRDMCRKQDKEVEFIISGEDTEVDRSIIDNLSSPLMHMIRNSIDHGIESKEERLKLGKDANGRVELAAYTEGRNVVITISDDGKGFNTAKILQKALDIGMITEEEAAAMSEEEINALVFNSGFSTNQEVTEYSGRGVGMDVVNDSMKKMNGRISVYSEPGKGTRIVLKIPLTLAIIDVILLHVGDEICAIPVSVIDEIFKVADLSHIRNVNSEDVVLYNDECCKIVNLFDFYTFSDRISYDEGVMILLSDEDNRNKGKQFVLFAQSVLDRQDVVVKPAPEIFKSIKGISGCTILGDGKISLILDVDELRLSIGSKNKMMIERGMKNDRY